MKEHSHCPGHGDSRNIQLAQWTFDALVSFSAYTVGQRGDNDFFGYSNYMHYIFL